MSIEVATYLMLGLMGIMMVMSLPLAFVTGLLGVGFAYTMFGPMALQVVASRVYNFSHEYALSAIPMFVLMASLLDRSGVARDLYNAMRVWAGGLRGGVGIQTLVAAVILAAMTGIIGGEIVLLGLIALPQMLRLGYDKKISMGIVVAGGSLGTMIPPSIVLIMYGLITGTPISDLFLATITPGVLLAALYILYVFTRCQLNPRLGPPLPPEERGLSLLQKLILMKSVVLPLAVAISVLGSIYAGIASVTEAAGMGVVGTLISIAVRRELSLEVVRTSLLQTLNTCGVLIWMGIGANILVGVFNLMGGTRFVSNMIGNMEVAPIVIILVMMGILLVLGLFMDWIGIALLTMPIFVPIVVQLGFDPVWFGILFAMNMQVSYISPPFGPAVFYLKGVAPPDITLPQIFNSVWPFMGLQLIGLTIMLVWPQIALWLPQLVYGTG